MLVVHVMDIREYARLELVNIEGLDRRRSDIQIEIRRSDSGTRNGVFISYSHRDRKWLEPLRDHLRSLERDHAIEVWDDSQIRPGTNWRGAIEDAIKNAKVAILLVSARFLASDFIALNELPPLLRAAQEDGARILPVIVSPCRFEKTSLSEFQAVNDPQKPLSDIKGANRDRVFIKVADEVDSAFLDR
jgi:hypothetical protein